VESVAPKNSLSSIPRPNSKVEQGSVKGIAGREGPGSLGHGFWINIPNYAHHGSHTLSIIQSSS
jgi:hypothetical protein